MKLINSFHWGKIKKISSFLYADKIRMKVHSLYVQSDFTPSEVIAETTSIFFVSIYDLIKIIFRYEKILFSSIFRNTVFLSGVSKGKHAG